MFFVSENAKEDYIRYAASKANDAKPFPVLTVELIVMTKQPHTML